MCRIRRPGHRHGDAEPYREKLHEKYVNPEYRAIELGVYAVYLTRKQLPLRVRRLVDFLVDAFRDVSWGS